MAAPAFADMARRVWFLPYAAGPDSPEMQAALEQMRRDGYTKEKADWSPQLPKDEKPTDPA